MNLKVSFKNFQTVFISKIYLLIDFCILATSKTKKSNSSRPVIIYIGEYFPVRIQRMVKLLKSEIQSDFVLYISQWGYEPKLIGNYFDRIEIYRNKYHLKSLLKTENNIELVHAFEPKAYYQYLVKCLVNAPFIYDVQDIIITYYYLNPPLKWQKFNLIYEGKLFQEADALISHSLELNEAMRLHQIKRKQDRLFFPLYCDQSNFLKITPKPINGKYQLVYIGGLNSISDKNSANFLPFIQKLESAQIDITIFPSPFSERNYFNEYKNLEKRFSNFKMMQSVPFENLNLSPFHFGIVPFENDDIDIYYSKNKYASTLKFFVYLEMGIPILISDYWAFPAWICKRYNLGIVSNFKELDKIDSLLANFDYNASLKSIEAFREKYTLQSQIPRLKLFYESMIRRTNKIS